MPETPSTLKINEDRILRSSTDWDAWHDQLKLKLKEIGMWEYSGLADKLKNPPTKPTLPDLAEIVKSANAEERTLVLTMASKKYDDQKSDFREYERKHEVVMAYVYATTGPVAKDVLMDYDSLPEMLNALKDRFAPTDMGRKKLLRAELEKLKTGFKTRDYEGWANDWERLRFRMEKHGFSDHEFIVSEFLETLKWQDEAFAKILLNEHEDFPDRSLRHFIQKYINNMRNASQGYKRGQPSTFATLQEPSQDDGQTECVINQLLPIVGGSNGSNCGSNSTEIPLPVLGNQPIQRSS